jgi:hypothetical protein
VYIPIKKTLVPRERLDYPLVSKQKVVILSCSHPHHLVALVLRRRRRYELGGRGDGDSIKKGPGRGSGHGGRDGGSSGGGGRGTDQSQLGLSMPVSELVVQLEQLLQLPPEELLPSPVTAVSSPMAINAALSQLDIGHIICQV